MVQKSASSIVFKRSARLFVMRLFVLLLLTFGGLSLLMHPDWLAAALITGLGAVVAVVWYLVTSHRAGAIVVDDEAIVRLDKADPVRIRWVDVSSVTIGETLIPQRTGTFPLRFVLVRGLGTRRIAFSDLTFIDNQQVFVGAPDPTIVTDIANAEVLLAITSDRVEESGLLETLSETEPSDDPEAAETDDDERDSALPRAHVRPRRRFAAGLLALALKLGVKAAKPVLGLFKGTQGVLAAASVGILALIFSWQGALILVGLILFHEFGHFFAMRRSGLPVRGIYLLPFGAATVADDVWKTRSQQAFIALGGPLWGAALTLVLAIISAATGGQYTLLGAAAALGALLNLLNLLPIAPLDGGRLLSAVSYSIHSTLGLALSTAALVVGLGLAMYKGLHLFTVLILVGLMELAIERTTARRLKQLSFVGAAHRFTAEMLAKLRLLTRPGFPEPAEDRLRELELSKAIHLEKLAKIEPMSRRQVTIWFLLYAALTGGLIAVLYWILALHPDLDALIEVLR